ncbi:hypothetical protein Cgig2_026732 [Carnegiea gigantea]|uniref:DUF8040 domain-containing protein n=1 Tax=Carnegiea gigantea TaxID=171969 RepID=A0A9Q1Q864_9CARY|nr:hypothetical protein Cgig2_026732 [Carnegiea gigantea]
MALPGRKFRNWTNKEDEKLLDGATQFEWSVVKASLNVQGIDRDATQIRNYYNFVCNESCDNKIKAVLHGRHVTGNLSFSQAMDAFGSKRRPVQQNLAVDSEERMGDSDEADDDEYNEQTEVSAGAESGSSGDKRRLKQELDAKVHNALELMCLKAESRLNPPPSTYEKVLTKLRQHPGVAAKGPDFIFTVMEYIRHEQDFDCFVVFNDDDITRYLRVRGLGDVMDEEEDCVVDTLILHMLIRSCSQQRTASHPRLPRMIGVESGGSFIHQVLNSTWADICRQLLQLDRDAFINLVNVIIERRAIDEGRFIKIAEIVALSLHIFTRCASYRDVEIRFRHSPSTISTYHNQVLETLVKLFADIVRPYRSQDEVPPEIA